MSRIAKWLIAATIFGLAGAPAVFAQVFQVPPDPIPWIPPNDDIILYIHGGPGSKLEEASDLVAPLQQAGLFNNKHYTIISFDQPSQGYSAMVDPVRIVPPVVTMGDQRYPLVQFSEDFIVAFVNQLNSVVPLINRNIYIIGGSTGGALTLRMGHRPDVAWLKKIVAWNAASTWTSFAVKPLKKFAVDSAFSRSYEAEQATSRQAYFDAIFGPPRDPNNPILDPHAQPNPEEWYRGNRYSYYSDASTYQPFRAEWACKWPFIAGARLEQQEIYNPLGRQWHWRLSAEIISFSFFNDAWNGIANSAPDDANTPLYQQIIKPTLLVASDDDDWNTGYIPANEIATAGQALIGAGVITGDVAAIVAPLLDALSAGLASAGISLASTIALTIGGAAYTAAPFTGSIYFQWENRWTQTHVIASKMVRTPGYILWVPNTGHSIHNERPVFFATQIANFLSMNPPAPGPLQEMLGYASGGLPTDEPCDARPLSSKFQTPTPGLLDNPSASGPLMQNAMLGGNFPDNTSPGGYGTRLRSDLRAVARMQDPVKALVEATVAFANGDSVLGDAYADLAVTGRNAYTAFRNNPPSVASISAAVVASGAWLPGPQVPQWDACVVQCQGCRILPPPKPGLAPQTVCKATIEQCQNSCLQTYPGARVRVMSTAAGVAAVQKALTRAYSVAWALRRPDQPQNVVTRNTLKWIAVSAEDDPPARPVNVPSGIPMIKDVSGNVLASYPQYDLTVTMCPSVAVNTGSWVAPYEPFPCAAGSPNAVPFQVRYTITAPAASPPVLSATIAPGPLASPVRVQPAVVLAPSLTATVCLTGDRATCWPATGAQPALGQPRSALVTVTSASKPVAGATVVVSGQSSQAVTNASGVAVVTYNGCVVTTATPVGVPVAGPAPCAGTVSGTGYQSAAIALP